jgi:hypothetical protein
MELRDVRHAHFRESGFMVVRNVLSPEEVATLRRRADEIIQDIDGYQCRDTAKRQRLQERYKQDVPAATRATTFTEMPEERISQRYVRRGDRVYPARQRPIDDAAVAAAKVSDNPWNHFGGTINHLADNDEVFRQLAAHPNVVKVLSGNFRSTSSVGAKSFAASAPMVCTPNTLRSNGTRRSSSHCTSSRRGPMLSSPSTATSRDV